jgi:hypothetical protein
MAPFLSVMAIQSVAMLRSNISLKNCDLSVASSTVMANFLLELQTFERLGTIAPSNLFSKNSLKDFGNCS